MELPPYRPLDTVAGARRRREHGATAPTRTPSGGPSRTPATPRSPQAPPSGSSTTANFKVLDRGTTFPGTTHAPDPGSYLALFGPAGSSTPVTFAATGGAAQQHTARGHAAPAGAPDAEMTHARRRARGRAARRRTTGRCG